MTPIKQFFLKVFLCKNHLSCRCLVLVIQDRSQHKGLPCLMLLAQVLPRLAPSRSRSESRSRPRQVVRGLMRPYRPPKVMPRGQPKHSRTTIQMMHQKHDPQVAILVWEKEMTLRLADISQLDISILCKAKCFCLI